MAYNDDHTTKKAPNKTRFLVFISFMCLAGLGILGRYAFLMLSPDPYPGKAVQRNIAERGPILDRNGRILALQTRMGDISLWKPDMEDPDKLAGELEPIVGIPAADLKERISQSASDFLYILKKADPSIISAVAAAKASGELRGIKVDPIVGRIYPEKQLAGQIIGFVGDDASTGLAGIEYAFESVLLPESGSGSQVMLTIDCNVQHILEEIASKTQKENEAEAVMLIAMDPRSGDILGSASVPDFDPNNIRGSDEKSWMDRPAVWSYEPGSVFKIISMSALLDTGAITERSSFLCNGRYERVTSTGEKITIRCLGSHGNVSARDVIVFSCNAGAAYAADKLGSEAFYAKLREFGFGSRTRAGNPGETAGFFRPAERWSSRSKPTIAMGQEIAVSALQMVQAATAIANDGIMVHPKIVSRIISNDGKEVRIYDNGEPQRILKPETARALRRFMTDVTSDIGTGWRANVEDLSLAVKTGTAQIIDPDTGAYSDKDFIASCMALLPADNPSLVLYIVIVKPKGESYLGGRIAAPPVREAAEALIDYLGIPRGRNPQVAHPGSVSIDTGAPAVLGERMPDFTGYSKKQLISLLLQDDIHIDIRGDGRVKRQEPPPGTPLKSGDTIILELE